MGDIESKKQIVINMIKKEAEVLTKNYDSSEVYNIAYWGIEAIEKLDDIRKLESIYVNTMNKFVEMQLYKKRNECFNSLYKLGSTIGSEGLKGHP